MALFAPSRHPNEWRHESRKRLEEEIFNGIVFCGGDFHLWPGYIPVALRAMYYLAKDLNPTHIIANGDVFDGPGKHPAQHWESNPSVNAQLEVIDERFTELRDCSKNSKHFWLWGNHDYRFEAKLCSQVSEYKGVKGFALPDHFPHWKFGISLFINDDVVIKHRFKGGVHATHNNTLHAGRTLVNNHLHSLKVTPFDDYNGTRYGVDAGTMNDPYGPHAEYTEDNPLNHRSGFAVLTFYKGKLLWPELVHVLNEDYVQFRGQVIKV